MIASVHDVYEGRAAAERQPELIYAAHFSLHSPPFTITPDTRFFFAHESFQIALNTLMVALRTGEGFTKVVGEVGTGKTLLCRRFLSLLEGNYVTAYIPNPYLEPKTLLFAIADEFGVPYSHDITQHQILRSISDFLLKTYDRYRCAAVICLDEAHAMPAETLEALRLLSNLETQRHKLLQIVLFGQPELDQRLNSPAVRQLKQRISFSCRLGPLDVPGVATYVAHRMRIAGYDGSELFSNDALRLLHKGSAGTPRLVNILGHKAMLSAYGEGAMRITAKHVQMAINDTESAVTFRTEVRRMKYVSVALGTLLASAGALIGQ